MDWLKLCVLLAAVASVPIEADGPKKKIRIHLPQAVKHIHHHKKIYITNHPAPTQYAPAFMPNAEGAVAVPTSYGLQAVANLMPINPIDVIDEPVRMPGLAASSSKILPLYRARGYYGPTHSELNEHDYDFAPQTAPANTYVLPSSPTHNAHHSEKIKVVKVHKPPAKKIIRKPKPKRIPSRKPASVHNNDEHPVSTFHEQFYSDVQGGGTIRKIKKPPRVEKIVDGNNEHIHTYNEEHIHKVVFNDDPKYSDVVGVEPIATAYAPLIPLKNGQLLTMASNPYQTLAVAGSIGTSPHYEYAAYNPGEVTHDHIFHDHGELPEEIDFTRDMFSQPPKVSYNSQGLPIGIGQTKQIKSKYSQRPTKIPPIDYSYYESIYSPNRVKSTKPTGSAPLYIPSHDDSQNEFKPVSTYRYKEGSSSKSRNKVPTYYGKPATSYRSKTNIPPPYSVSSKIIHDYSPTHTYQASAPGSSSLSLFDDTNQFVNFKDSYVNNFEYDNYASSSNIQEESYKGSHDPQRKGTNSIMTQNINFGAKGLTNFAVNNMNEGIAFNDNDGVPSALENVESFDQPQFTGAASPTVYTAKDSESPYQYYAALAVKALDDQMSEPDASNNNFQYAVAPATTTPIPFTVATTSPPNAYQAIQATTDLTSPVPKPEQNKENKIYVESDTNIYKPKSTPQERHRVMKEIQHSENLHKQRFQVSSKKQELNDVRPPSERSKLRYGDKI